MAYIAVNTKKRKNIVIKEWIKPLCFEDVHDKKSLFVACVTMPSCFRFRNGVDDRHSSAPTFLVPVHQPVGIFAYCCYYAGPCISSRVPWLTAVVSHCSAEERDCLLFEISLCQLDDCMDHDWTPVVSRDCRVSTIRICDWATLQTTTFSVDQYLQCRVLLEGGTRCRLSSEKWL